MSLGCIHLPASIRIKGRELKKLHGFLHIVIIVAVIMLWMYVPELGRCTEYPLQPFLRLGVNHPEAIEAMKSDMPEEERKIMQHFYHTAFPWAKLRALKRICDWDEAPVLNNCTSFQEVLNVRSVVSPADTLSALSSYLTTIPRPSRELPLQSSELVQFLHYLPVNFRVDLSWRHPGDGLPHVKRSDFEVHNIMILNSEDKVYKRVGSASFSLTLEEVLTILQGMAAEETYTKEASLQPSPYKTRPWPFIDFDPVMMLGSKIDASLKCFSDERSLRKNMKGEVPSGLFSWSRSDPVCIVRFTWIGQARNLIHSPDGTVTFRNEVLISALPGSGKTCITEASNILRLVLYCLLLFSCPSRIIRHLITKRMGLLSRIYKRAMFFDFSIRNNSRCMAMNVIMQAVAFVKLHKEVGGRRSQSAGKLDDDDDDDDTGKPAREFLCRGDSLAEILRSFCEDDTIDRHLLPKWRMQERLDKATGFYYTDQAIMECINEIWSSCIQNKNKLKKKSKLKRSVDRRLQRNILWCLGSELDNDTHEHMAQYMEDGDGELYASAFLGMCFGVWHVNYIEVCHLFDDRRPMECLEAIFTPEFLHVLRNIFQRNEGVIPTPEYTASLEEMHNFRKKSIKDLTMVNLDSQQMLDDLQLDIQRLTKRHAEEDDAEASNDADDGGSQEVLKTWRDWISEAKLKKPGESILRARPQSTPSTPASNVQVVKLSEKGDLSPAPSAVSGKAPSSAAAVASNAAASIVSASGAPSGAVASGFAQVYRDGAWVTVSTADLLPGDLLRQEAVSPPDVAREPLAMNEEAEPSKEAEQLEITESAGAAQEMKTSEHGPEEEKNEAEQKGEMERKEDNSSSPEATRLFMSYVRKLQAVLNRWEKRRTEEVAKSSHKQAQSLVADIMKLPPPRQDVLLEEFSISDEHFWEEEVARYRDLSITVNRPAANFWAEFGFHGHQDDSERAEAPPSPRISELQAALRQRCMKTSFEMPEPMSFHHEEQEKRLQAAKNMREEEVHQVIGERVNALDRSTLFDM